MSKAWVTLYPPVVMDDKKQKEVESRSPQATDSAPDGDAQSTAADALPPVQRLEPKKLQTGRTIAGLDVAQYIGWKVVATQHGYVPSEPEGGVLIQAHHLMVKDQVTATNHQPSPTSSTEVEELREQQQQHQQTPHVPKTPQEV